MFLDKCDVSALQIVAAFLAVHSTRGYVGARGGLEGFSSGLAFSANPPMMDSE